MRRADREITDTDEIRQILDCCKVLRLAMSVRDEPYIVPLNFGCDYLNNRWELYFHCAGEGKKLDIVRSNNSVCFEMDCDLALAAASSPCGYGYYYRSVIGFGKVDVVVDTDEKALYLSRLMKHQTGKDFSFTKEQVQAVTVCRILVTDMTAKARMPG